MQFELQFKPEFQVIKSSSGEPEVEMEIGEDILSQPNSTSTGVGA
jgi:hypothetical protein